MLMGDVLRSIPEGDWSETGGGLVVGGEDIGESLFAVTVGVTIHSSRMSDTSSECLSGGGRTGDDWVSVAVEGSGSPLLISADGMF